MWIERKNQWEQQRETCGICLLYVGIRANCNYTLYTQIVQECILSVGETSPPPPPIMQPVIFHKNQHSGYEKVTQK